MCLEVLTWRQSWEQIFEVCVASHFVSHLHYNPLVSAVVSVLSVLTLSYGLVSPLGLQRTYVQCSDVKTKPEDREGHV